MDVDPLQDTVPPRYAIESDEEEDEFNPLRPNVSHRTFPKIEDIELKGNVLPDAPLIVASAHAGVFWAKGADLGEQAAGVYVNKIQVGMIFQPDWAAGANVLVSESFSRLPLDFMHPYAKFIIENLKPSRTSLLDTYSSPAYSSLEPISTTTPPLRYLSTGPPPPEEKNIANALPLEPPNLLQSTSAAFLLHLRLQEQTQTGSGSTILLLPSAQLPTPPPKDLLPSRVQSSPDHQDTWPASTMTLATQQLLLLVDLKASDVTWKARSSSSFTGEYNPVKSARQRGSEIGEGSMYL